MKAKDTYILRTDRRKGTTIFRGSNNGSQRMERGCHRSATEHKAFVRDEMANFGENGFWVVLPYITVKNMPGLRLPPLGIK